MNTNLLLPITRDELATLTRDDLESILVHSREWTEWELAHIGRMDRKALHEAYVRLVINPQASHPLPGIPTLLELPDDVFVHIWTFMGRIDLAWIYAMRAQFGRDAPFLHKIYNATTVLNIGPALTGDLIDIYGLTRLKDVVVTLRPFAIVHDVTILLKTMAAMGQRLHTFRYKTTVPDSDNTYTHSQTLSLPAPVLNALCINMHTLEIALNGIPANAVASQLETLVLTGTGGPIRVADVLRFAPNITNITLKNFIVYFENNVDDLVIGIQGLGLDGAAPDANADVSINGNRITELRLENCQLTSGLQGLHAFAPYLARLSIVNTRITGDLSVESEEPMTDLRDVELETVRVDSFTGLARLAPNLQRLTIQTARGSWHLSSPAVLFGAHARFEHLETLTMTHINLSTLIGMDVVAPQLRVLNVRNNRILNPPPVQLPQLTRLDMSQNRVDSLAHIATFAPRLTHLDVSHNEIVTLPNEITLEQLEWMNASSNLLTSLANLATFAPHIQTLDVSRNHIRSLPATPMPSLKKFKYGLNKLLNTRQPYIQAFAPNAKWVVQVQQPSISRAMRRL